MVLLHFIFSPPCLPSFTAFVRFGWKTRTPSTPSTPTYSLLGTRPPRPKSPPPIFLRRFMSRVTSRRRSAPAPPPHPPSPPPPIPSSPFAPTPPSSCRRPPPTSAIKKVYAKSQNFRKSDLSPTLQSSQCKNIVEFMFNYLIPVEPLNKD